MSRLTRRTKDHLGRASIAVGVHKVYKYSPHYEAIEKLACFEDLEEQGRLIETIRCKDCGYFTPDYDRDYLGYCRYWDNYNSYLGYCSGAKLAESESK